MRLVIDGYFRELGQYNTSRHIPADTPMACGEYRYHYGHAYDGNRKAVSPVRVMTEEDCWRNVLDEALLNLPTVEVEGDFLSCEDWKLKIHCSSEAFINLGLRLLATQNDDDHLVWLLRRFADVSFRLTPSEKIEAYLASDKHVRQECCCFQPQPSDKKKRKNTTQGVKWRNRVGNWFSQTKSQRVVLTGTLRG